MMTLSHKIEIGLTIFGMIMYLTGRLSAGRPIISGWHFFGYIAGISIGISIGMCLQTLIEKL